MITSQQPHSCTYSPMNCWEDSRILNPKRKILYNPWDTLVRLSESESKSMKPMRRMYIAEVNAKKERDRKMAKPRYARFVRAMKKLGYADNRNLTRWSITEQQVLDQILKDGCNDDDDDDDDDDFWDDGVVYDYLKSYRDDQLCSKEVFGHEFEDKIKLGIQQLGGGDVLDERVTPESIFEQFFDDAFKEIVPIHCVRRYIGVEREKELCRKRGPCARCRKIARVRQRSTVIDDDPLLTTPQHLLSREQRQEQVRRQCAKQAKERELFRLNEELEYSSEEEEESPFAKECRMRAEEDEKMVNDQKRTFYKAIKLLGGEDNLENVTAEALLKLIVEELESDVREDYYWTIEEVEDLLTALRGGCYPKWTWKHHNRMLEAIEALGGDPLNEERVNPKAVFEFMDDVDDPMTLNGVKTYLGELQKGVRINPNHPSLKPKKVPKKPKFFHFCSQVWR